MIFAEEIAKKIPINKTAALVTAKGVHFKPGNKINSIYSEMPLRTIPVLRGEENHTGKKFGFFTVAGKYFEKQAGNRPMWVVRCSCGNYETRRSRSINNPANKNDSCHSCRELMHLKRQDEFHRTGQNTELAVIE